MGNDMSMIEPHYNPNTKDYNLGYPKYGDVIRWRGNLKVYEGKKKKGKDAHVIVTKHRIYFFDPKVQKIPECHSHLFDIIDVEVVNNSKISYTFKVGKKEKQVTFLEPSALEMTKTIRSSIRDTTNNYGEERIITVKDLSNLSKPTDTFTLTSSSAMVEAYLSICNYRHELPSINHIYFLQKLNSNNHYSVDFSLIPGVCDGKSPLTFNLSTAFTALSYNNSFSQIKLRDVNVGGIDKAISAFLKRNSCIQVLEIVNCGCKLDVSLFAEELEHSPVQILSFEKTPIVKSESLGKSLGKRVYKLIKLNLNKCGITKLGEFIRGMMMNEDLIKNIVALNFGNNNVNDDSIEQIICLINRLSEINGKLEFLDVSNIGLPLDKFITALKGLNDLHYLNITGNKWNKLDKAMELINYFQSNKTLKQISMNEMKFQVDHIVPILSPIATNENIQEISLDLKDNGFGVDGGVELYKILPSFKNVKKLDISNNKLKGKAISRILTFMNNFIKIESLCIGNNPMSGKDLEDFIKNLIEFVKTHENLKILAINGISEKNEPTLNDFISSLESNTSLLALDISDNHLDDTCTIPLCEVIMHNHTLIALNFDANDITTEGFLSLSYAIEYNNTISFVDYPAEIFKNVLRQKLNNQLTQRFQESFYMFFNKVKSNKYNNYFNDVRIFDTINSYPIEISLAQKLNDKVEPKIIVKPIVRGEEQEEEYEMAETFKSFQQLKKNPNFYYD